MSDNPTFLLQGTRRHLSDLELLTTLGVGTFGRVHLCRLHSDLQGEVFALKVMKKTVVLRLKQVEHVSNEKSILQLINSPFVPRLYACFQSSCCLYLLSEFVVGGELFKRLRSEGAFPNDVALFYVTEIGGSEGVKAHRWFQGVDFLAVHSRLIPAPWLPEVLQDDDTSNYDSYPDSSEPQAPVYAGADPFQGF